jgi:hypothetical protein
VENYHPLPAATSIASRRISSLAVQCPNLFEQINQHGVKATVFLRKSVIALLLPVILLAVLLHCTFELPGSARLNARVLVVQLGGESATGHESACSHHLTESIRQSSRRVGGQNTPVKPLQLPKHNWHEILAFALRSPTQPAGEAFLLQQRWQFLCDAADSPRAPSLIA